MGLGKFDNYNHIENILDYFDKIKHRRFEFFNVTRIFFFV